MPSRSRRRRPAGSKLQRWIDLVAELLRRNYPVPVEELARGVPAYSLGDKQQSTVARMFERDKDELRAFGIPIETVVLDGDTFGYRLRREDFYLPYLLLASSAGTSTPRRVDRYGYRALKSLAFEPDELAAVAGAAVRVRQLGDPFLESDVDSAMRKLAFDLSLDATAEPAGEAVVAEPYARASRETLALVGNALLRRKRIAFEYHSMGMGRTSRRSVEPYGLFFVSAHWYLAGRDRERDAIRNFRVSRMENVVVNTAKSQSTDYQIPASFRLAEHARSRQAWELGDGEAEDAIAEFSGSDGAVAAAARLGEPVDGAPSRRRFRVRRLDSFARWLLSFGGDARPISPPALVERHREIARATLARYESAS